MKVELTLENFFIALIGLIVIVVSSIAVFFAIRGLVQ